MGWRRPKIRPFFLLTMEKAIKSDAIFVRKRKANDIPWLGSWKEISLDLAGFCKLKALGQKSLHHLCFRDVLHVDSFAYPLG